MVDLAAMTLDEMIEQRRRRYHQTEDTIARNEADALEIINELGFIGLINLSKVDLPSLQYAAPHGYRSATGDTNEATWGYRKASDNTSEAKWFWDSKQTLSGRKACYYAKVIRGRGTFISWECFPFFYSAYSTGNDYEEDYHMGVLSRDEKRVLDMISSQPGIPTNQLRRVFGPPGKQVTRELGSALQSLQETFRITVAGGLLEGWSLHYWALVEDWVPEDVLARAARIDRTGAKRELILRYLKMAVAASVREIAWVFQWQRSDVSALVHDLVRAGQVREAEVSGLQEEVFSVSDLVSLRSGKM